MNTGVVCHFLLQGIFLTQGSNLSLLHLCHQQADSLPRHHLGSSSLWGHLLLKVGCGGLPSPWYCRNTLPGYWKEQLPTSTHMCEQAPSLEGAEDLWDEKNKSHIQEPLDESSEHWAGTSVGTLGWGETACSLSSAPETSTHWMWLPIRTWGTQWVDLFHFLSSCSPWTLWHVTPITLLKLLHEGHEIPSNDQRQRRFFNPQDLCSAPDHPHMDDHVS